mgnify:CR=1 FL=1
MRPALRRLTVQAVILAGLLAPAPLPAADPSERPAGTSHTGDIRAHSLQSTILGHARRIWVYLPPGYEATAQRYPVLYLHDGQNVFNRATSFIGVEWGADETAEALILAGEIEPLILVAVANSPDRMDEYTPAPDPRHGGGKANAYGRFLAEEVKPWVDATFRTRPEPEFTGVAGSSLGGLVSLYFGISRPDLFTRIGAMSPSVWWARRDVLQRIQALPRKTPVKIWIDIGTDEGGGTTNARQTLLDARALRDAFLARGWKYLDDLYYLEVPGAKHNEAAWAARLPGMLKFLYPPEPSD